MKDPLGIVPPEIRARYEQEEWVERGKGRARALERALKDLDPGLSVVFVRPNADPETLPGGCVPGRWHVKRDNPAPAVSTYMAILAPDGGYREPDFGVLNELRKLDLQRTGVMEKAIEETNNSRRKDELAKEQRKDELVTDIRAAKRVPGEGGLKKRLWGKGRIPDLAA